MDTPELAPKKNLLVEFFAVIVRPRTYGSMLYAWLAFPLGLAYFVGLVVGLAAGVPLTIVWIGLAVLLATFSAAWAAEGLERQMAIRLLGAAVPARLAAPIDPAKRFARLRAVGSSTALWKGIVFLFLKFPLGIASFVFSIVALVVPVAFIASPFALLYGEGVVQLGFWEPTTFAGALPLSLLGVLALFVSLHLHNVLGWIWARLAERLLGVGSPADASPAPCPPGRRFPVAA